MKGLNLASTNISELRMNVNDARDDATLQFLVDIYDDSDPPLYVKPMTMFDRFTTLPVQEKAALNNFLRLRSKRINNEAVEEDSVTWVDL